MSDGPVKSEYGNWRCNGCTGHEAGIIEGEGIFNYIDGHYCRHPVSAKVNGGKPKLIGHRDITPAWCPWLVAAKRED